MNLPYIQFLDAEGLANNAEPALIVLDIARSDIEAGNIGSVMERLYVLTDTQENVMLYRESLVIMVGGFDRDPRELPEIEEVRRFFQRLVEEWPHWVWFLARGIGSIGLLLSMLCRVRMVRGDVGFGTAFESEDEVRQVMAQLLERGTALFSAYRIPECDAAASAETAIIEVFGP